MRLVLVYAGVAGLSIFAAHRFVRPVGRTAGAFLVLLPVLFLGEAFAKQGVYAPLDIAYYWEPLASYRDEVGIHGVRTPLLADVVYQHIPWRKAVREAIKNRRLPVWNRFQLAGEPLLAVQQPAVLHPETLLGLVLPLGHAWTFAMALRILLAALTAYLLLRDMGCSEVAACTGATAWALCDFLVFFLGFPPGAGAAPFPLLVMGLRRIALAEPHGFGISAGATALIIAAGHPETSLHAIAAAGLFFVVSVWREARGHRTHALAHGLLSGFTGTALMAVTLIPFFEVLPSTLEYGLRRAYFAYQPKAVAFPVLVQNLLTQVLPYAQGVSGRSLTVPGHEAAAYAGSVVLVLAIIGSVKRRPDRFPLAVIGILGTMVAIGCPGAADLVGKLPFFAIAINQRLVFVGAFALAVFAGFGVDAVLSGRWRLLLLSTSAVTLAVIALWVYARRPMLHLEMSPEYMRTRVLLQLVPLGLLFFGALAPLRKRARQFAWALPFALLAVRYGETGRLYPVAPARAFFPPLEVLAPVDRTQPYRIAAFGLTFVPNIAALYELEDVRAYDAMTLARLAATFPLWCVPQPVWFNRIDDPTRPFLSFLNVRYMLVPTDYGTPPGWKMVKAGKGTNLLENHAVLPRAFAPRWVWCDDASTGQLNTLSLITDYRERGVAGLGCTTPHWRQNGPATTAIQAYTPDGLTLTVTADARTVIGTSIPSWPGWQITVDDQATPPFFYNHAFLGVHVPAGQHTIDFRYRPRGVVIGALISLLAVGSLAIAMAAGRPRQS